MAIQVLAEKTLEVNPATKNYDKATVISGIPNFPEKHYFALGTLPKDATHIKCRYYIETDEGGA